MYSKSNINFSKINILLAILFILGLIVFYPKIDDNLFALTNIILMLISFWGMIFNPKEYYSLKKFTYLFFFIFFGIIPLNDLLNGNLYWGGQYIEEEYYYKCNFYSILGLIAFSFANKFPIKNLSQHFRSEEKYTRLNKGYISKSFFLTLISTSIFLLIFYKYNFNLYNILVRGHNDGDVGDPIGISDLIFDYVIRPLPMMIFFLYFKFILKYRNEKNFIFLLSMGLFQFIIALFAAPPTGLSRFLAGTLYIALLLLIFQNFIRHKNRLNIIIIFGIFFVFPFLDKFRYFDKETFDLFFNFDFLNTGNFDAYQNFVRAISSDLITNGMQFLGVILFWVPRMIWPNKPEGSGFLLAKIEGLSLDNISFPYIAEGWVNFGFMGVLGFMYLWGFFISTLDYYFWHKNNRDGNFLSIPYFLMFGVVFFIMRGNLLSSFAYSVALFTSYLLAYKLFNFIIIDGIKNERTP